MIRLFLIAACLALAACGEPPTIEQRVVAEIRNMEAEFEAGERLNFLSHVTEDFRGQGGAMSREQLRALVVLQFQRYENIEARLFPISVEEISASEARAEFNALLTGGAGWLPEDGQLYHFRTHWRLEDGDWRLAAASWAPATLGDTL